MEWPANLRPVRDVVFECLKLPEARNKYFCSTQLADLCNIAAGVQALHGIDKQKIARAFSNGNMFEYSIGIPDLPTDDLDSEDFLHVYISIRFERHGTIALMLMGLDTRQVKAQTQSKSLPNLLIS